MLLLVYFQCQLEWDKSRKILGSGAFGIVYLARKRTNKQKQAVKVLKVNAKNISTLQNELDIHRGLQHRNIIQFIDSSPYILEPDKDLHIIMECIPGGE